MTDIIIAIVSGSLGATLVKIIGDSLAFRRERKAKKEDNSEKDIETRLEKIETKTDAQSEALKFILYDRIRFVALSYIEEGEVDFDDRRILNDMHRSYHVGLNGNGDLDELMKQVNKLPLKLK